MSRINWKKGLQSGLKTSWVLTKVVFPITFIIMILKQTPLMAMLTGWLTPFMSWFGLDGSAAIPLALGNLLSIYAAISATLTLSLTVKQVFILAIMLSFSHNMIVESAICKRVGVATWVVVLVRVGLAILSGVLIHLFWHGGNEMNHGVAPDATMVAHDWLGMVWIALLTALNGIWTLVRVVFPLMFVIQLLKDFQLLDRLGNWLTPLFRPFGLTSEGTVTLTSGLFAGLMFGAGLLIQQAEEHSFSKREITLIFIFLAACHAVVEDTVIFIPLNIPVIFLLLIRLVAAILLTGIVAKLWVTKAVTAREEQV